MKTIPECINCEHLEVCEVHRTMINLQNKIWFVKKDSQLFRAIADNCKFYKRETQCIK